MTLLAAGDPRTDRALAIAAGASAWHQLRTRDGELVWGMPSQTTRGLYYLVTETTCTCPDFEHNGLRPGRIEQDGLHLLCKHIRAIHFLRLQREAAAEGLVLERLPSGEWAWLKSS